jgi:hypothetical protein
VLLGESVDSTYPTADYHADAVRIDSSGLKACLLASLLSGDSGELGKSVHSTGFFAIQVIFRIEAFDLGGESRIKAFGVKGRNEVDSRSAVNDAIPRCGYIQTKRTYDAHACN